MNLQKITFALSLVGILLLIFLTQTKQHQIGTIKTIQYSNNKITIQLENSSTELIIFNAPFTNLQKGNLIKFYGKTKLYKNKKQIIIEKIFLLHPNKS